MNGQRRNAHQHLNSHISRAVGDLRAAFTPTRDETKPAQARSPGPVRSTVVDGTAFGKTGLIGDQPVAVHAAAVDIVPFRGGDAAGNWCPDARQWHGPGVDNSTVLHEFTGDDSERISLLHSVVCRAPSIILNFGDSIPLDYVDLHINSTTALYSRPTAMSELIAALDRIPGMLSSN